MFTTENEIMTLLPSAKYLGCIWIKSRIFVTIAWSCEKWQPIQNPLGTFGPLPHPLGLNLFHWPMGKYSGNGNGVCRYVRAIFNIIPWIHLDQILMSLIEKCWSQLIKFNPDEPYLYSIYTHSNIWRQKFLPCHAENCWKTFKTKFCYGSFT